jgi:hypothetical protein
MKRHWRDLAERAAKAAFSPDEVRDQLPHTLRKDAQALPLNSIRDILGGGHQSSLFHSDRIAQLEAARDACRGSALGNALIDCAVEAVSNGLTGDTACRTALANAFGDHARNELRSVEEHYQREAGARSARYVRDRLDAARSQCDFTALASGVMTQGKPDNSAGMPKRTGLDEGPLK